jgi:formylglycine-generating enzyme required for sulfatase activity
VTPLAITNSIGMRLLLLRPGQFRMGSPESEAERYDREGPPRLVRINRGLLIAAYPVTQEQYFQVMGSNPSWFSPSGGGREKVLRRTLGFFARVGLLETRRFPVESVSWHDAMEFCRRLSELPEEKKEGRVYRLPTEAEWEYACRAGTETPFHCGLSLSSLQANFDGSLPYGGAEKGPFLERTSEVGSYPPNVWGLYDLHGNVWEWCLDWYDEGYYAHGPVHDPSGPEAGVKKVLRGGAWCRAGRACRSAYRAGVVPEAKCIDVGFRVVCVKLSRDITQTTVL